MVWKFFSAASHSHWVLPKQQLKSCLFLGTIEILYPGLVHFPYVFQTLQVFYDVILLIVSYISSQLTKRIISSKEQKMSYASF